MLKLFLDRLKQAVMFRVFTSLQTDLAHHTAVERAELLDRADEYERAGRYELAAQLRHAASRVGHDLAGLDDLDAGLSRLGRPDPLSAAPDALLVPFLPSASLPDLGQPAPTTAVSRSVGRPRKPLS